MNEIVYPDGCQPIEQHLDSEILERRLFQIQEALTKLHKDSSRKFKKLTIFLGREFSQHLSLDVQLHVACCLAESLRIHAPSSPFPLEDLFKILLFLAKKIDGLASPKTWMSSILRTSCTRSPAKNLRRILRIAVENWPTIQHC